MTSISIDIKDGLSSSVAIKGPCRAATTANITLSGEQTIDGVALVTDDRVLVKDQTTASDNGIYVVDTGSWRRAKDFNKAKDVKTGTTTVVTGGTVGSGWWQIATTGEITIGTTDIAFSQSVQSYDADLAAIAALSTTPYGRSLLTMAAAANLRDSLDTPPYVTTRTALLALDTTKDPLASFDGKQWAWSASDQSASIIGSAITSTAVNSGTEIITKVAHGLLTQDAVLAQTAVNGLSLNTLYYVIRVDADNFKLASTRALAQAGTAFNLTGTTNFAVKKHIDPDQFTWVTPAADLSGASGAWTELDSVSTSQFFAENSARVRRINDRFFIGDATKSNGRDMVSHPDWMTQFELSKGRAGGSLMFSTAAISNETGTNYNRGGANTLLVGNNADSLDALYNGIAIRVIGKTNNPTTSVGCHAVYVEAYRDVSAGGTANGMEINVMNYAGIVHQDPWTRTYGETVGLGLGAGGEYSAVGQFDSSSAISIWKNVGASWRKGITFGRDAITGTDGTDGNVGTAICMATGHAIEYRHAAGETSYSWRMYAGIGVNGDYNLTTQGTGNVKVPRLTVVSGQVVFPSTQVPSSNANTLDDYSEQTYTPAITAGSGTFTSVSATGSYTKVGRLVSVQMIIVITTVGTAAGAVVATLPFTANATGNWTLTGRSTVSGKMLQGSIIAGGTNVSILTYDNLTPAANVTLSISGTYWV